MKQYDVLIIGGGIAGVSLGYELAPERSVGLLEMEPGLAQHTTGRSAATFLESYGGHVIRILTTSSREFLENPPDGFEGSLLRSRPLLWLGPVGRADDIRGLHTQVKELVSTVRLVDPDEAAEICPVLRPDYLELGMLEPGASDIDVHGLHQGYTRGLRQRGGDIHTDSQVASLTRTGTVWTATTTAGEQYQAPVVVNAAGAWADVVAERANVERIGIHPLLRTIFMLAAPEEQGDVSSLPLVGDIDLNFYFKPEGPHQFLCSPSDETPREPGDAKADEVAIARALEQINNATTLGARHVKTSWGGLRNFVADRVPVAGFDTSADGFFWFVGQGGYGIQTAPALARSAAALLRQEQLPNDVAAKGLNAADLSRARISGQTELQGH